MRGNTTIQFNDPNYDFRIVNSKEFTYAGHLADKYKCQKTQLVGYHLRSCNYLSVPKTRVLTYISIITKQATITNDKSQNHT
jgi:hypothetical protein